MAAIQAHSMAVSPLNLTFLHGTCDSSSFSWILGLRGGREPKWEMNQKAVVLQWREPSRR